VGALWRPGDSGSIGIPQSKPKARIDTSKLSPLMRDDNRWAALLELGGLEETARQFQETAWAVAKDHGAVRDGSRSEGGRRLEKETLRAILVRRKAYKAVRKEPSAGNLAQYKEAKATSEKLIKAEGRARYINERASFGEALRNVDLKTAWDWVRRGWKGTVGKSTTIKDPSSGDLVSDPGKVAQIWANWFGQLAKDTTGHSRDKEWWRDKQIRWWDEAPGLNNDLTWTEVRTALKQMGNGKACGVDGIPAELLKLTMGEEDEGVNPGSLLGKTLPYGT
jgi:hypothetical protein